MKHLNIYPMMATDQLFISVYNGYDSLNKSNGLLILGRKTKRRWQITRGIPQRTSGLFIASLELFGLAAITADQRTKEIGIRKVLGASVTSIVTLLSGNFLKLIVISILIASPIAWFVMHRWLQEFAYKVDIGWSIFGYTAFLALGIALLTVSYQALQRLVKSYKVAKIRINVLHH
jgi:predicted lysophospholipase L1 biosynthesis ABC-type transport system permease subunit